MIGVFEQHAKEINGARNFTYDKFHVNYDVFSGLMFMLSRMIKIFNNERNWLAKNLNSAYKGNEQCIKEENEEDRIFKLCEEIYDLEYKVCNEKSEETNEENKRKLVEKYEN